MRIKLFAFSVALALAGTAFPQTLPPGVEKKANLGGITEYAYPNGLRVLLFPDPSSPKVTVNMTYLVGSRFEGYGETGMAHLLEHMNFIRSTHDRDIKKELTDHGAQWNGTTDYDRTNYFETVTASDDNLQVGARPRSRAHGQHADGKAAARHRDDRRAQRIRARREQRPEHPRRARRRHRVPLAQLRQVRHRLARRHREGADRPAGGVLSQVLPAGQRRAGDRRTVRCVEGARDGGRHRRRDSAADAQAGRALHRRARAGRRAIRRAAPRGIESGGDGGVARAGAGASGFGGARSARPAS